MVNMLDYIHCTSEATKSFPVEYFRMTTKQRSPNRPTRSPHRWECYNEKTNSSKKRRSTRWVAEIFVAHLILPYLHLYICPSVDDIVAEWLRRWIANPLLFERVGSNPTIVVVFILWLISLRDHIIILYCQCQIILNQANYYEPSWRFFTFAGL